MPELVTVHELIESQILVSHLQAAGIDVWVEEDNSVIPTALSTYVIHIKNEADLVRARKLLKAVIHSDPTHCANCGYNLTGLPEPRCPECGLPYYVNRPAKAASWVCESCGETLDGTFTACWKCAGSAPRS